jgi:hypothetical protein
MLNATFVLNSVKNVVTEFHCGEKIRRIHWMLYVRWSISCLTALPQGVDKRLDGTQSHFGHGEQGTGRQEMVI